MGGHDVFISYASEDKLIADAACAVLERNSVRCWIAPRDVALGMSYTKSIMEAIASARIMVLVFSEHANGSPHVEREIERAVSKGLSIIPIRIKDVLPRESLEYLISTTHWLDALTPPLERHLDRLSRAVRDLLATVQDAVPRTIGPKSAAIPQAAELQRQTRGSLGGERSPKLSRDAVAAYNLGVNCTARADVAGAVSAYQSAIDLGDPEVSPQAALNLGILLQDQGDLAGATALYQYAIDNGHPEISQMGWYNFAELLHLKQGDVAAAATAYRRAIDLGPTVSAAKAKNKLAAIRFRMGDLAGAAAGLEGVMNSGHRKQALLAAAALGDVREKQGDLVGATVAWQYVIDNGDDPAVSERLQGELRRVKRSVRYRLQNFGARR